jgi:hypothetical protein
MNKTERKAARKELVGNRERENKKSQQRNDLNQKVQKLTSESTEALKKAADSRSMEETYYYCTLSQILSVVR